MKNKFIFFLAAWLFINIHCYDIRAEEFVFESEVIEITNDGNKIQAKNGVRVSTKNNIEITAEESTFDKNKLILSLIDGIKIIDKDNNIKIEGENIIYYVHYFLGVLGKSEKIPISVSIWMPIILLTIISSIGLVRINEK